MSDGPECAFHPNQGLTNFCMNNECWLPLCPECINIHLEEHRMSRSEPLINTLENVRHDILQRVSNISCSYKELNSQFQSQRKTDINKEAKLFDKIDLAKQKVLNLVESYFNSLKTDIKDFHYSTKSQRNTNYSRLQNIMDERNREIDTYLHKLTTNNFVKYIVMIHSRNSFSEFEYELENLKRELEFSDVALPEVILDENAVHGLNIELARYINFIRKDSFQVPKCSPEKRNVTFENPFPILNHTPPRNSLHFSRELPGNPIIEYRSLTPDRITLYPSRSTKIPQVSYCNELKLLPHPQKPLQPINFNNQIFDPSFVSRMASGSPPHHLLRNSYISNSHSNSQHPHIIVEGTKEKGKSINIGEIIKDHHKQNRSYSNANSSRLSHNQSNLQDESRINKVDRMSLVNNSKIQGNHKIN